MSGVHDPVRQPTDTRRLLRRLTIIGLVIIGLAFTVWARSCGEASACEREGGTWNGEWRVCVKGT